MKKLLIPIASIAFGLMAATAVQAQAWPSKPVTMIVPFPPGGSTDMIARTLMPKLVEKLGGTLHRRQPGWRRRDARRRSGETRCARRLHVCSFLPSARSSSLRTS